MSGPSRLVETVRRLRASQVGHRLVRRLERLRGATPPAGPAAPWAGIPPLPSEGCRPSAAPGDRPDGDGWSFAGRAAREQGGALAWAGPGAPTLLQRYHAAYGEHVRALSEAGDLGAASRWLPATLAGPDHPYVRSRRILALVEARAHGLAQVDAVVRADAEAVARRPEWDARGNHLVANGAALVRAGGAFSGPAAGRWSALGASLLTTCVREQVLADGVHYERSPVYQGLVLEHLLVALETWAARGTPPAPGVEEAARRLAAGLFDLTLPDGALARWRDGAPGIALPASALRAWASRRAGPLPAPRTGPRAFPDAGFAISVAGDARAAVTLVAAAACPRDLPAHGHADALAYEAVLDGVRVVASAGTAAYGSGPDRDRDRLPGAFAGVRVEGRAPAEPYGAFRIGARGWARRLETGGDSGWSWAAAAAGGFAPRSAPTTIRRTTAVGPGGVLVVCDEVVGRGPRAYETLHPLLPGLSARVEGDSVAVAGRGRAWRLTCPGARLSLEEGRFALGLGDTIGRPVVRVSWGGPLPFRVVHFWTPGAGPARVLATVVKGGEVRVDLVHEGGALSGFLAAGTRP